MAHPPTHWSLATFAQGDQAMAALEVNGVAYRLEPSLARVGLAGQDSVLGLFANWERALVALNAAATQVQASDQIPAALRLAPLLYPGKILCAGANYFDHLAEMGMPGAKKEDQRLFFFMKPPRNAVVGEGDTVHMPINTQAFDWEVELALVIGKTARNVSVEQALSHVAAYTVAIDFSAADAVYASEMIKLSKQGAAMLAELVEKYRREVQALAEQDRQTAHLPQDWYATLAVMRPLDTSGLKRIRGK